MAMGRASVVVACIALAAGCGADSGADTPGRTGASGGDGDASAFGNAMEDLGLGAAGFSNPGGGPDGVGVGGTGGMGGGVGDEPNCGAVEITPKVDYSPGNILVVFDRSGSMEDTDFNGMRRFDAANAALVNAVQAYTCGGTVNPDAAGCSDPLTLGSILFPSGATLLCDPVVPFEMAPQITWRKSTEWLPQWNAFGNNPTFGLGTPIEYAFMEADRVLTQYKDTLEGTVAVLFLTDGGSTCFPGTMTTDGTGTIPAADQIAAAWAADGIRTHVVSVQPGGSAFNDRLAQAGGTGSSINPANQQEIDAAMASIIQETAAVASCDIVLEGGALDDLEGACERGDVTLGPTKLACDPVDGFSVTGSSAISLHGAACDALMAGGYLTATFPCDVVVL